MKALIELHYLPSLEYFCCLLQHDGIILERHEHFTKQTYRSRSYILGGNNVQMLNIPVAKGKSKTPVKDLRTDTRQPWKKQHWKSIRSAYGNAPFFEFYAPELEQMFQKQTDFLIDFTYPLLTLCLKWLGTDIMLDWSEMYENEPKSSVIDLRSVIEPKSGFENRAFYTPVSYMQVFGKNFVPNLSIVDLLSCEGPNALSVLKSSAGV